MITELKLLAEMSRNQKKREVLERTVINMNEPGVFEAKIIDKRYENGAIVNVNEFLSHVTVKF